MTRMSLAMEVRAPTGAVFEYADNHENYAQFFHGFAKFEWTDPRHQVGTRLKMEGKVAGITVPVEIETTEVVPDQKISGTFVSGVKGDWEWLFEPAEDITMVTFRSDIELPMGILGQVVDRTLVDAVLRSNMEKTLTAMKEKLEARRR